MSVWNYKLFFIPTNPEAEIEYFPFRDIMCNVSEKLDTFSKLEFGIENVGYFFNFIIKIVL